MGCSGIGGVVASSLSRATCRLYLIWGASWVSVWILVSPKLRDAPRSPSCDSVGASAVLVGLALGELAHRAEAQRAPVDSVLSLQRGAYGGSERRRGDGYPGCQPPPPTPPPPKSQLLSTHVKNEHEIRCCQEPHKAKKRHEGCKIDPKSPSSRPHCPLHCPHRSPVREACVKLLTRHRWASEAALAALCRVLGWRRALRCAQSLGLEEAVAGRGRTAGWAGPCRAPGRKRI